MAFYPTETELKSIDVSHILTEDDVPVDNFFSAKQQRLLVQSLYDSWKIEQTFIADSDIGVYARPYDPPIVPDVFISLDVEIAEDWYEKENRSYFYWEFGKPPDVVIEVVSNKKGGEATGKVQRYARMNIPYYVIYDPQRLVQNDAIAVYEKQFMGGYILRDSTSLDHLGLRLGLWRGEFENKEGEWLRWFDEDGDMLLTGKEQAKVEKERADIALQENLRLAEKLRELGIDPDTV